MSGLTDEEILKGHDLIDGAEHEAKVLFQIRHTDFVY